MKLAETLHVRRSTVEQAVSRHFKAQEIQELFDAHGGLAKYKERACSALNSPAPPLPDPPNPEHRNKSLKHN